MRGVWKRAKPAGTRPLDGRVRPRVGALIEACHFPDRLPKLLAERGLERMIEQRFDGLQEAHGVRQFRMTLKRGHVLPASVDVELIRVPNRAKRTVAEAARLLTSRALYFKHCSVHLSLLSGAGMETGEDEYLHGRLLMAANVARRSSSCR